MSSRAFIFFILALSSCTAPAEQPVNTYMDIKGFFEEEASRLTGKKQLVNKTVKRNEVSETKNNVLPDWNNELALFIESDINKPAWRNGYKVIEDSLNISYTALDVDLRTRSVQIKKGSDGQLIYISIHNQTRNNLYQSSEQLTYIPDSLYSINKKQDVLLLGNNRYTITGIFK